LSIARSSARAIAVSATRLAAASAMPTPRHRRLATWLRPAVIRIFSLG